MDPTGLAHQLSEATSAIADTPGLESICCALESGLLDPDSTAAARAAIAGGDATLEHCLRSLQAAWRLAGPALSPEALALVIRTSVASVASFRRSVPTTQVVWTGPKVEGSYLRTTREVVREILRGARHELLVVGYWIAARDEGEGIIEEVISAIGDAVGRGVAVTIVIDERLRFDGRNNRSVLLSAWPAGVKVPRLLTWHLPPGDAHLKLHAKVLVADRRDALVTSANLTSYAMDRNMEMGARIVGTPAGGIADHFDLLAECGVLALYHGLGGEQ